MPVPQRWAPPPDVRRARQDEPASANAAEVAEHVERVCERVDEILARLEDRDGS